MKDHPLQKFIPQVEPYITDAERKKVDEYMRSGGWLTEHEKTREFERSIAEFVGSKYAVVVTSGTVALYLALLACGMKSGQSVVVPDYTMIATPNSVKWAGADVILTDVQRQTLCLDLSEVKLKPNTRALMYVSMNGRADKLNEVVEFCHAKGLTLIEDAAQSLASKWRGKYLGTFGDAGVYSFTPHKIITTGQGGAVVTNDKEIYEKVSSLKDFSRVTPGVDTHTGMGFNFKFTDLQAVIGLEQLRKINFRMKSRRDIYRWYREELSDVRSVEFLETDLEEVIPWFADVLLSVPREAVASSLKEHGIGSRPFYPPIHTQIPYAQSDSGFSVTTEVCPRGLWLPSSIGLSHGQVVNISRSIKRVIRKLEH
ncbi:MAG: DegT/DnrJ/EryC1/StrS family aminotransferase [Thaumarchaeota archaeon]|nr:DegT/DnrJ/EryC1/StrS family aminotransferase [Nitrososphaerota archaeon]